LVAAGPYRPRTKIGDNVTTAATAGFDPPLPFTERLPNGMI
jgi:hypothetical protein